MKVIGATGIQAYMQSKLFTIEQLENGIYRVMFFHNSRTTVDCLMQEVEAINRQYRPDETVRYLVDKSVAGIPLAYTFLRAQDYVRRHVDRPRSRTAVLYPDETLLAALTMLNVFLHWLDNNPRDHICFLPFSQRDSALAWLLQDS